MDMDTVQHVHMYMDVITAHACTHNVMHFISLQTANSQRMAELLGGDVGGVIGFDTVSKRRFSETFRSPGADNTELQVVLKQLGKRDTTTKLKVRVHAAGPKVKVHADGAKVRV